MVRIRQELKKTIGNVTVEISNGGYYDKDGKIPKKEGIHIQAGKSNRTVLSPQELLIAISIVKEPEFSEELQARYDEEKSLLAGLKYK